MWDRSKEANKGHKAQESEKVNANLRFSELFSSESGIMLEWWYTYRSTVCGVVCTRSTEELPEGEWLC